ncbi:hypothetical protein V6N13_117899 [Hibiscus sabdariffa]
MKRGSLVLSPEIEERWLTDVDLRQRKDLLMRKAVKAIEVGGSGGLISLWDKNRFVILVSIGSGNHGSCIVQLLGKVNLQAVGLLAVSLTQCASEASVVVTGIHCTKSVFRLLRISPAQFARDNKSHKLDFRSQETKRP